MDVVLRELSQAQGYIAQVGKFKSLGLLNLYFSLIKKRVSSEIINNAFYLPPEWDDFYRISVNYTSSEEEAIQQCALVQQYQLDCTVEYVEFGY